MGSILSKGSLFPEVLLPDFVQNTIGSSAIAKLCGSTPIPFNGTKEFTFTLDKEVDIVAENGAKGIGGATIGTRTIVPLKVEYGCRISDEFKYASEEVQMNYLAAFSEGFARKVAKGLDLMVMHGINPRTATASAIIGTNCFDRRKRCKRSYPCARIPFGSCGADNRRRRKAVSRTCMGQQSGQYQWAAHRGYV